MIILSLGSNLSSLKGDNRFDNIKNSIKSLCAKGFKEIKTSSFYETPSYPDQNNPKFINIAISIKFIGLLSTKSIIKDEDILNYLIFNIYQIEKKSGRIREKKNDPRIIDIDIIDYNNKVLNFKTKESKLLEIPHKKMALRNFVLYPLKEICPEWKHPNTGKHIDILINELSDIDKKSILKIKYT